MSPFTSGLPDWQRNARWFSQRPRRSRQEFGPAAQWPLRSWGSAAHWPETQRHHPKIKISPSTSPPASLTEHRQHLLTGEHHGYVTETHSTWTTPQKNTCLTTCELLLQPRPGLSAEGLLTVLPPLPMTLPAAVEGTLMCVSSLTSSFPEKKFSSFSFPNIRPCAWNTEEGMRQGEAGEDEDSQGSTDIYNK